MKTVLFGKRKGNSTAGKAKKIVIGNEYEQIIMIYTHEHIIMKPITVHANYKIILESSK